MYVSANTPLIWSYEDDYTLIFLLSPYICITHKIYITFTNSVANLEERENTIVTCELSLTWLDMCKITAPVCTNRVRAGGDRRECPPGGARTSPQVEPSLWDWSSTSAWKSSSNSTLWISWRYVTLDIHLILIWFEGIISIFSCCQLKMWDE